MASRCLDMGQGWRCPLRVIGYLLGYSRRAHALVKGLTAHGLHTARTQQRHGKHTARTERGHSKNKSPYTNAPRVLAVSPQPGQVSAASRSLDSTTGCRAERRDRRADQRAAGARHVERDGTGRDGTGVTFLFGGLHPGAAERADMTTRARQPAGRRWGNAPHPPAPGANVRSGARGGAPVSDGGLFGGLFGGL
jgi:hypothetical protein